MIVRGGGKRACSQRLLHSEQCRETVGVTALTHSLIQPHSVRASPSCPSLKHGLYNLRPGPAQELERVKVRPEQSMHASRVPSVSIPPAPRTRSFPPLDSNTNVVRIAYGCVCHLGSKKCVWDFFFFEFAHILSCVWRMECLINPLSDQTLLRTHREWEVLSDGARLISCVMRDDGADAEKLLCASLRDLYRILYVCTLSQTTWHFWAVSFSLFLS